ncbi:glycine cleavage T C-terminal barrel domain-containing protein [Sorangium sp. So ce145]|uniref:glycine cleavage T C-terminal barrel domain-containing protein n=1 Tax=Sorangium sp. So ce145 TaxID=3133285 RepID=UPI003F604245
MAIEDEVRSIRSAVALGDGSHVVCLRLAGEGAFDALDRVSSADLFLQDAQMRPSLLLRDDGVPFADIYVCRDDESFFLLSEGPSAADLIAWLRDRFPEGAAVTIDDLGETHAILSLHGPYAWELLGECLVPDLVGMPYLSFYRVPFEGDAVICFRGGKTGEYGYDLVVDRRREGALRARIEEVGRAFDLGAVSLAAVDRCALENGFFNIRHPGCAGLDPLELQLQWRTSSTREYAGSAALRALRERGAARRVTYTVGEEPLAERDSVVLGEAQIGALIQAAASPTRGGWVAIALIDRPYAHAGIDRYAARSEGRTVPIRTVSPPLVHNRSLYVSPQRHGYRTRAGDAFPPLV